MGSLQAVLRESSQEVETFGHSDRMRSAMGPWKPPFVGSRNAQVRHCELSTGVRAPAWMNGRDFQRRTGLLREAGAHSRDPLARNDVERTAEASPVIAKLSSTSFRCTEKLLCSLDDEAEGCATAALCYSTARRTQ